MIEFEGLKRAYCLGRSEMCLNMNLSENNINNKTLRINYLLIYKNGDTTK